MKFDQIVIKAPLPADAAPEVRNDIDARVGHLRNIAAQLSREVLSGLDARAYALSSGGMSFCINGTASERAALEAYFAQHPELGFVESAKQAPKEED